MKSLIEASTALLVLLNRHACSTLAALVMRSRTVLLRARGLRPKRHAFKLRDESVDGAGLNPEFRNGQWERLRDTAYGLPTKSLLLLLIPVASANLYAQRWDTTAVKNGRYSVFQRDAAGRAKNPVAVYDTTGRLLSRVCWHEGKLHGPAIQYDSLGRKTWLETYRMGKKHGTEIFFHPNGQAAWKVRWRNGVRSGVSETYHPNGRIEWSKAYRGNRLYGERVLRDSTGALLNGEYLTVFPLGMGQYKTICTNGRPQGELVVLRGDGTVAYTGRYNKGYPDGEFIYYDKSGKVYRTEFYAKGRCLRSSDDVPKAGADEEAP